MRVTYEQEHELIARVLGEAGAPAEHAATQARALCEADLRGRTSHGVQRLPTLVGRIRAGLLDPGAVATSRWSTPAVALVDGHDGFGPVVGHAAAELACDRSRTVGVAVAAVSRASHLGLLAPYVESIVDRGLIGMAMTTSEALVHAWGGSRAVVGTNPLAIGVPAADEPFVLDMSTGMTSMGNVIAHARTGRELPDGWAVDRDGAPTQDAEAALDGAISPFGAAKGYGLGLGIGLLVATLTGTALGTAVQGTLDSEHASSKGDLIVALDPVAFGDHAIEPRLTEYLRDVRRSGPTDAAAVAVPGDRAREARRRGLRDGIEIDQGAWDQALDLLDRSQVNQQAGVGR